VSRFGHTIPGQEVKIPVELVLQGSSGENKQLNSKFVSKFGANDLLF
jgi:hypothetical protein